MSDFENKSSVGNSNVRANLLVWVGLILLVVAIGAVRKSPKYSLFKHWAITQGRVTQELPQSHGSFDFAYVVGDKTYTSVGYAISEYRIDAKIGDPVIVHYDKANPGNCTLNEPKVDLVLAIGGIVAECAIIPLIAMMVLHHYKILPEWNLFKKIRLV
jgi:hypothetical protein